MGAKNAKTAAGKSSGAGRSAPGKPSLMDVLRTEKHFSSGLWEDDLSPDIRRQLDEVKAAINSGALKCSKRAAYRRAKEMLNLDVAVGSFLNYLSR